MANFTKWAGIVALVISVVVGIKVFAPVSFSHSFGAVGNMLAENYDPYIRYNGGFNTALPVTTSGALTTGSLSVPTTNAATSTTSLGCIQTTATSTATPIRFVIGSTQAATTTFQGTNANFTVLAQYGSCPA